MTETAMDTDRVLELRNISKRFGNGTLAVENLSLSLARGSFVSLLGPSGCGKSTVLRMIAGLSEPTAGEVVRQGTRGAVGFVFQEPTLMPWETALSNTMLPLDLAGVPRDEARRRAAEALEKVGLKGFEHALPRELSGGMKMRVSIARAIVTRPQVLLLDEPFAALDEITRFKLNNDLLRLWQDQRFTAVFVTHSVFESVYLSQRVIVMAARPGRLHADLSISPDAERGESFRTSAEYAHLCRQASEALEKAMHA
ncbi:MAG: nitrate/sulfonate/bicarbonate ABC transporter ATP-binding protein [Bordetella sp. SCN 67-23]|nr:ABC transporter ATP-binding protein [Burkholderiales bacterium]ODS74364.1 MAG: nitrate/sulfonate/bicarbonate ABC transporter ATP-binding protein [Bordetella sp. SCN 67-23]ODU83939.1 MAG: nitrate/sulfonate/bicarbonate ABC transporter ATP-binding protein [Bordetella sp. SCN 68-11]OJW89601.1 MAG: nitrate/sulfonate/bicarbonate ABC transporter ATP-binding protein [Burkholderiales bacterium 67-32]